MKHIFLTSSVHAVAHEVAAQLDLTKNNRLAFITTAAEPEEGDLSWLENDRSALVQAGFEVTDYTLTGKNTADLTADLAEFAYIYMSGGDTFYLLEQSQKSGFIPLIQDWVLSGEKTYISTSAGSIIAGPRVQDYLLEEGETSADLDQTGYELVEFTVLPHWGSRAFREKYISNRLEIAYKRDQVPLLTLTDWQYVHIQGKELEIITVMP